MKAGFIGLGAMGAPMARHLHASGLLAAVWNRTRDKAHAFAAQHDGVDAPDSPERLAEAVDVIVLCVSADDDVRELVNRIQPGLEPGKTVVDHSTVAPATARDAAERAAARGSGFVDAPVTGGVEGANEGRLAIMAGGERTAFERLEPLFSAYGKVWRHLGPVGSGQAAKAVNQLIVAGIAEAVCEGLALVERMDLPRQEMLELLAGGAAGSWFLEKRGRTMLDDSFETGFDPKLLLKDLKICAELLEEQGFESTVLPGALDDYARLVSEGDTGRDISA
ncbi:MAG: NAD(P)-dependent oxidoreductase, partial [Candidatus Wenzhouxiangella sp. M2_3B_020]